VESTVPATWKKDAPKHERADEQDHDICRDDAEKAVSVVPANVAASPAAQDRSHERRVEQEAREREEEDDAERKVREEPAGRAEVDGRSVRRGVTPDVEDEDASSRHSPKPFDPGNPGVRRRAGLGRDRVPRLLVIP
jgi:hypothetical protein